MQEQNIMTREEVAKYGLRQILGFSSTKQLRQVYADGGPVHTFHVADEFPVSHCPAMAVARNGFVFFNGKAKGGAQ